MLREDLILVGLVSFGFLVSILFVLDIYFSLRPQSKKEKKSLTLDFSENFLIEVERAITQEIKHQAGKVSEKMILELTDSFKKELFNFLKKYEEKFFEFDENSKRELIKLKEASLKSQEWFLKEIKTKNEQLVKDLEKKFNELYQKTFQDLNQAISQIDKEVENYKKQRLKEIERKIYQIIGEVAKKTIGKTIDLSTHEELVWQELEKAKREKLF